MASKKKAKKKPAAKKKARSTAKASKRKQTRINFGFTVGSQREAKEIEVKANKLAGGNVSKLLRHAVHTCKTRAHTEE